MSDSSASTIILLASAAVVGTILCIAVTIAIIKRKNRDHDDEAVLSPSHDHAEMDTNRAYTLEQLPALVLGVADESEGRQTNEQQSPRRSLLPASHMNGHTDTTGHLCARQMNGISMGEHNLAMTDITDIDNEDHDTLDGLRVPRIDAATADRRGSQSESILTSTKVIFVQDSLSSRSSTSSSNKSCEE